MVKPAASNSEFGSRGWLSSDYDHDNGTSSEVTTWARFGEFPSGNLNQPDPQRAIFTSRMFRSGATAFVVFGEDGVIDSAIYGETGLYVGDMRIVSKLYFTLDGQRPHVVGVSQDEVLTFNSFMFANVNDIQCGVDYTLDNDTIYGRVHLKNNDERAKEVVIEFDYEADHYDTFYVRFPPKPERGHLYESERANYGASIRYDCIDGKILRSFIQFSELPIYADGRMSFKKLLNPGEKWDIFVSAGMQAERLYPDHWKGAKDSLETQRRAPFLNSGRVETNNKRLGEWIRQSQNTLCALTADRDTGLYPYAGLPWFALPFGRDGLITGFETIQLNPQIMNGVLRHHAKFQARKSDEISQASPGKMMHEMRLGETSRAGLNPFSHYYGGIDTTPLFVMAAGAYYKRTADRDLIEMIWPNIKMALHWIKEFGDPDGDGLLEYRADPGLGLTNQGWKDSWDAIVDEHGQYPQGPIALCEVQGYAYSAWRAAEYLANELGYPGLASSYSKVADDLYARFNEAFWVEELRVYALALDGQKRQCRVRASNMGHLPWCGIVPPERGRAIVAELLGNRLFSGWGIRTLAEGERAYRPDHYHRGPCWPHEMAIAGFSAKNVGDHEAVRKIAEAMLDTAEAFEFRLPELLCGYTRVPDTPPVRYKSANPLHAWAAGVAFATLQSCLGLDVDAVRSEVRVDPSGLPRNWLPLSVHNLQVKDDTISFSVEASNSSEVKVRILQRSSDRIRIRSDVSGNSI